MISVKHWPWLLEPPKAGPATAAASWPPPTPPQAASAWLELDELDEDENLLRKSLPFLKDLFIFHSCAHDNSSFKLKLYCVWCVSIENILSQGHFNFILLFSGPFFSLFLSLSLSISHSVCGALYALQCSSSSTFLCGDCEWKRLLLGGEQRTELKENFCFFFFSLSL